MILILCEAKTSSNIYRMKQVCPNPLITEGIGSTTTQNVFRVLGFKVDIIMHCVHTAVDYLIEHTIAPPQSRRYGTQQTILDMDKPGLLFRFGGQEVRGCPAELLAVSS